MEKAVRHALYWPDGTRKKLSKSSVDPERINHTRLLVQALLDKYNEDHNLLGNLAYELKDIMCIRSICEGSPHNCHCRGCTYNKRVNLKHPNDADEFSGGHLDPYLPYGGDTTVQYSGSDENLDAEEEEAKLQAKEEARCLDDPSFLEQMRRRFKDDPRAETFFQPKRRQGPQHATPLPNQQDAMEE
ncbi:hypothetical protein CFC21_096431 [Triticum aestivum]|uniref:Transposase-associated domain-containing protein n=2 Tax=Triticum aestivum TaxID=4565 RepID=A0A9R1LSF0_WHEAT|nr:hypothetical protein CFC21_096431 [Triticum aestivum]